MAKMTKPATSNSVRAATVKTSAPAATLERVKSAETASVGVAVPKGRYIDPRTDFGFKRIFGNSDFLISFLNGALELKDKIVSLQYKNAEQKGRIRTDRSAFFDLHCTTGKGEYIIVEMQNMPQPYFKDRALYYVSLPIQKQAKRGKWNFRLNPVYSVNILDFKISEDSEQYHHYVQLMDRKSKSVFYDKLALVFIELPDFNKTEDELKTVYDRWLYILKHLSELHNVPDAIRQDKMFKRLFREAEVANMNPEELDLYDQSLKNYWDMYTANDILKMYQKMYQEELAAKDKRIAAKDKRIAELERLLGLSGAVLEPIT